MEAKFRIWNGIKMVYDITAGRFGVFYVNPEKGDGLNPNDTASLTPNTTKYSDGIHLMAFTGLTDKNGKEIFEGDICKRYERCSDKYIERRCSIVYREDGFKLEWLIGTFFNNILRMHSNELEVIGNIYENPELLCTTK